MARFAPRRALASLDPADPAYARAGERLAERFLRGLGMRLVARRLRTRWGELDLVLHDGPTLVVVEVKTGRCGPRFRPGLRLDRRALARRRSAAGALARGGSARVDLVEVLLRGGEPPCVAHHRDLRAPLGAGGARVARPSPDP